MQIIISAETSAPSESLYAVLTDLARLPETVPGILRLELLTPGPVRVGTRFRETRRMLGREATEEMEVAELVPPRLFAVTAESHGTRYRAVHAIEPRPGGSRIAFTFEGMPVTFAARLFAPLGLLMLPGMKRMLREDLLAVVAAAERQSA